MKKEKMKELKERQSIPKGQIQFPKESIDEAYFTPILPPIFPKESIDEVIIL